MALTLTSRLGEIQVWKVDGGVCFFGVVVGEETSVGECPSEDIMDYHDSDLIRFWCQLLSVVVFGAADLFVGAGDIGVVFSEFGLFTGGLAIPLESRYTALRHG